MSEPSTVDGFPIVAMIGGGQLARMTVQAGIGLNIGVRVLAEEPNNSAAKVATDVELGDPDTLEALVAAADGAAVVTFDHEQVPPDVLRALVASDVAVRPGPESLIFAQDKLAMRRRLTDAGLPNPRWLALASGSDSETRTVALREFGDAVGWPIIIKASRGGYDGRGVWHVQSLAEALEVTATKLPNSADWLIEEAVVFEQELAAQVARSPHGQAVAYPIVRTIQVDGMCREVIAPAPHLAADRAVEAQRIALTIAELLGVTGMLAVEMFDTGSELIMNELAMRPHNSGPGRLMVPSPHSSRTTFAPFSICRWAHLVNVTVGR